MKLIQNIFCLEEKKINDQKQNKNKVIIRFYQEPVEKQNENRDIKILKF